jgi:outer membrane lipoprotein carrier protein
MNKPPPAALALPDAGAAAPLPPRGANPAARQSRLRGLCLKGLAALALGTAATWAWADAVDSLRAFVRDVKSGQATFTQTVTSADGARQKVSKGDFEFARPNRFRFGYTQPFVQLIVADGQKVWIFDADLNQASSRKLGQALGATPAALLAGAALEPEFVLAALPAAEGLAWVLATPRVKDGPFQAMRVGFRATELVAVEITDSFGQKSRLDFSRFVTNTPVVAERFVFKPPAGADVVEQ